MHGSQSIQQEGRESQEQSEVHSGPEELGEGAPFPEIKAGFPKDFARGKINGTVNTFVRKSYYAWNGMMARCFNTKHNSYFRYGGRGITVCEKWRTFLSFAIDMGLAPSALHSIDRINNNGNYEPGNCRWATDKVQTNNSRGNRIVSAFGQSKTIAQWSEDERCSVSAPCFRKRIEEGWNPEIALIRPARPLSKTLLAFGERKPITEWIK